MTDQNPFIGTKPVADSHKFDQIALSEWMSENIPDFTGPLTVEQFKGGQSNPTYKLKTPKCNYVMRRKPPGKLLPSAHAVDREFRIISALYPLGFPVARPFGLCEDPDVIGTMFYIMEMVEGRVLWNAVLPDYTPDMRAKIYDAKVKTFAALHNIDWKAAGLTGFGKEAGYVARQIKRWTGQYQLSETVTIPDMNALIDWLPKHIPSEETTTIVHGDYRLDNMILHPDKAEVLAVLDWELSTLGDPMADFSYHLMNWVMPSPDPQRGAICDIEALESYGIPNMAQYAACYFEHRGIDATPTDLDFYFAYNGFRLAAICQGIVGRVRDGTASSAHAEEMAARVAPLAAFAARSARRAGMV